MNIVAVVGNLATDPELRTTAGGRAVCTFRLAVSRPGGEQADFFTVVAWERQAEICHQYLTIGRRVAVEGRLHHSTWEAEEQRRSAVEIIAHRVQMLGGPRRDAGAEDRAADTAATDADTAASATDTSALVAAAS
jgi:single-strand DNA-binding protein